jgi:hypothetical protein
VCSKPARLKADSVQPPRTKWQWRAVEAGAWPFRRLADELCVRLTDPCWEVRHGAATALSELLRSHAACAGVLAPIDGDAEPGWAAPGGLGKRRLVAAAGAADAAAAAAARAAWLQDCISLLLAVLALDRFADYVSDQVVPVVRETAAQALAMAAQPLDVPSLSRLMLLLLALRGHKNWHVRHGALVGGVWAAHARAHGSYWLACMHAAMKPQMSDAFPPKTTTRPQSGIKYLLAVRPEAAPQLLLLARPALADALSDREDAVQAAAADALVPVAGQLLALDRRVGRAAHAMMAMHGVCACSGCMPSDMDITPTSPSSSQGALEFRAALWRMVRGMGELSTAASSSMALLAALYSPSDAAAATAAPVKSDPSAAVKQEGQQQQQQHLVKQEPDAAIKQEAAAAEAAAEEDAAGKLAAQLPLLWRYLRHPLTGVRLAAAQCLERLAGSGSSGGGGGAWLAPILGPTLRLLFQSLVMETDERVRAQLLSAWHALLRAASGALAAASLGQSDVAALAQLAATPVGGSLDQRLLVAPDGAGGVAPLKGEGEGSGKGAAGLKSPPPTKKARRGGSGTAGSKASKYEDDGSGSDLDSDADEDGLVGGGNRGGK